MSILYRWQFQLECPDQFQGDCKQWWLFCHIWPTIQLLHALWSVQWESTIKSVGTCHVCPRASSRKICLRVHWWPFTRPCHVWSESIWGYVKKSLLCLSGLLSRTGEMKFGIYICRSKRRCSSIIVVEMFDYQPSWIYFIYFHFILSIRYMF